MRLTLLYFAWVRVKIGHSEEVIDTEAETLGALIEELKQRSPNHEAGLAYSAKLRFALDQNFAELDQSLKGISEVAIFPPMTGG